MKSEKSIRSEIATLATVLAIPLSIAAVFPFEALSFKARPVSASPAFLSFVKLTDAEEAAAVKAAKTSMLGEGGGHSHRFRADLPFGVLPESEGTPVIGFENRAHPHMPPPAEFRPTAYLPSSADAAPKVLPHDPRTDEQPFTRADLLKLF